VEVALQRRLLPVEQGRRICWRARGTTEPHCVGLKDFPSLSSSTPSQGLSYPIEPSGLSGCFSGDTTGRTTSAGL
jgi:hypothetical protein